MLPCSVCRNRKLVFRKLWQSGDCTYGCGVCGVTPARDVTTQMMSTANAGTRVAAGVSSRCLGLAAWVFEKLHEGSVGQVDSVTCGSERQRALSRRRQQLLRLAGQGSPEPFAVWLVTKRYATTKGLTECEARMLR